MKTLQRAKVFLFGAMVASLPLGVMAQPVPRAPARTESPRAETVMEATVMERDARGHRVIRSGVVIHVQADRQRPYPFTLSGRAPLGYQHVEDRRAFAPSVLEVLRKTPF